jgi:hypothetical protein
VILDAEPASRVVPPLIKSKSYQRLRVSPAGGHVAVATAGLGRTGLCLGGGIAGASLGLLFPASAGDARVLIAVVLGVAGALAGTWLYNFGTRLVVGAIRWAVACHRAGMPVPAGRFLQVSGASAWTVLATSAVLTAAVPVLAIWGAVIVAITLSGSRAPSHGAALGNVIAGALAIVVSPLLARLAIRRLLAARHRVRDEVTRNLA